MSNSTPPGTYYETVMRCTWNCADQQDSLLQSCLSWAEQSRTPWYREYNRLHEGKGPGHLPRLNRVFLHLKKEAAWPAQGDLVRARSWVAVLNNRSFELHSDITIITQTDEEVPVARVQTVRVLLQVPSPKTKAIFEQLISPAPTPTHPSWKAYEDKPGNMNMRTVRLFTRQSDIDAVKHVNNTAYPKFLFNAFWPDSNEKVKYVKRMDVDYIVEVPAGIEVDLHVRKAVDVNGNESRDDSVRFVIVEDVVTRKVLNVTRFEFDLSGPGMARYDRTRAGRMAPSLVQYAMSQIDVPGPFRSELYVGWEETSTASAYAVSMLRWADVALVGLWCMMSMKSFVPLSELFGKTVIVMQRSSVGRIFKRPVSGTLLVSEAWISKTGTSSMEFYCHFKEKTTGDIVFASKVTKVAVNLKTGKKTDKLFFDAEHFRRLYAGLQCVDIPEPKYKFAPSPESLAYTYRPLLRHQDQDTLGHLNSYLYMNHIHDARDAWLNQSKLANPAKIVPLKERHLERFVSDSWLDSFGIEFMGENKKDEDLAIKHFRPSREEDPNVSWFTVDAPDGKTRTRMWTRARSEPDNFNPFILHSPEFYNVESRKEGVNENMYQVDELPAQVPREVAAAVNVQQSTESRQPASRL